MNALELVNVSKNYRAVRAVDNLSLKVPEGSLYGLIGPNGAGKTTTFNMMSGFLRPTEGEVRVRGTALTPGHPPVGKILSLPQDAAMPPGRKVINTLVLLGQLSGMGADDARSKAKSALQKVGLGELETRKVSELSHGQRRRVGIAQCLVGTDEVVLLDEPTSGLDPRTALELGALIKELHKDHTIVLSSHNLSEVESLCTHAAILDRGKLVSAATIDELKGTGEMLQVILTEAPADAAAVSKVLSELEGVDRVEPLGDEPGFWLYAEPKADVAELTNAALMAVIQAGAKVKGVERGKKLEERFMETTGQADA